LKSDTKKEDKTDKKTDHRIIKLQGKRGGGYWDAHLRQILGKRNPTKKKTALIYSRKKKIKNLTKKSQSPKRRKEAGQKEWRGVKSGGGRLRKGPRAKKRENKRTAQTEDGHQLREAR